jgi:branched-chain amino acid aminotransferase
MSFDLVWLNGAYVPASEARISAFDRGLAYGDGAFTTLRVGGGEPLLLRRHLARLALDLGALYIPPPGLEELAAACHGLVERLDLSEAVLKITVTRGAGGRGLAPPTEPEPTAFVAASPLTAPRPPLRAATVPDERGALASHKSLNYLASVLALREARDGGCDEALFVRDGALVEATVSNLVGLVEGSPRTPAGDGILPGIARGVLLESGAVEEGELPADTPGPLYCVNSVRGVEAVGELDGRALTRDSVMEARLVAALRESGAQAGP